MNVDTYDLLSGLPLPEMKPIVVTFPDGIPPDVQAAALMHMEIELRQTTGLDCRVFKKLKGDDSKLRVMMTPAQRDKL